MKGEKVGSRAHGGNRGVRVCVSSWVSTDITRRTRVSQGSRLLDLHRYDGIHQHTTSMPSRTHVTTHMWSVAYLSRLPTRVDSERPIRSAMLGEGRRG